MRATKAIHYRIKASSQLLVQTPQPNSNQHQTQNQKQLFLQKVIEDEVVGLAFLLLNT